MNNLNDGKIFFSGFVLGAFTFILLLHMTKPEPQQPDASKSKFEVVDTYMGCDIIKRENKSVFESQYFMDCRK
jgi:hypothetical protein